VSKTKTEFREAYWADRALNTQGACNASGLLRSMVKCADEWREATQCSDQWDNVALRFMAHQVAYLAGGRGASLYDEGSTYSSDDAWLRSVVEREEGSG
jgi:hypothetical protein